jgi:hypothetical protein
MNAVPAGIDEDFTTKSRSAELRGNLRDFVVKLANGNSKPDVRITEMTLNHNIISEPTRTVAWPRLFPRLTNHVCHGLGFLVSYRIEAQIHPKYILTEQPDTYIATLSQIERQKLRLF